MLVEIKKYLAPFAPIFQYGPVAAVFTLFQGRATTFAIVFSGVGIYGFLHQYNLTSFTMFVTAIQALVFAHSIKEDYFTIKQQDPSPKTKASEPKEDQP